MQGTDGSSSGLTDPLRKHAKLDNQSKAQPLSSDCVRFLYRHVIHANVSLSVWFIIFHVLVL